MADDQPASYLTLTSGTDVTTSDGESVGKVQHVLSDPEADIFDGLVIDVRTGPGGLRFVDAAQVAEIQQEQVVLGITASEAESLPAPSANPATMESHGAEDSESPLEHKLRRAWEIVSGKG